MVWAPLTSMDSLFCCILGNWRCPEHLTHSSPSNSWTLRQDLAILQLMVSCLCCKWQRVVCVFVHVCGMCDVQLMNDSCKSSKMTKFKIYSQPLSQKILSAPLLSSGYPYCLLGIRTVFWVSILNFTQLEKNHTWWHLTAFRAWEVSYSVSVFTEWKIHTVTQIDTYASSLLAYLARAIQLFCVRP